MRIAIDARFYGTEHTGLGRYTTNVLSYLPKYLKNHELFVLLKEPYFSSLTLPSNCTKVRADIPHYSVLEQFTIPFLIKKNQCDLLYTLHFNSPALFMVPSVITIHDLIKSYFTSVDTTTRSTWFFYLKRLGYQYVLSKTILNAKDIIVPTNTVKNQILINYPKFKPEHIHPIKEAPDQIFRQKRTNSSPNPKLELPDKYLLYVGNAYPHKNLKVLLDAFTKIKDPELHLVIVSSRNQFLARTLAPYEPRKIHIYSKLSDLDLKCIYEQAIVLVTPSLMEGYGLPGLEALMVNTPVIASNIPVYREVYGDKVIYFDPHSVPSLVQAIVSCLSDNKAGSKYLITRTWDQVAKDIAEVINESCASL